MRKVGDLFSQNQKAPDDRSFFPNANTAKLLGKKGHRESASRGEKKINAISKFFNFRNNDYNLAVNTHFWTWSNFNSFAKFVPLMTNDGGLESSYQGEFVLGLLAGGRHNFKNNNFVQGKQTVRPIYCRGFLCIIDGESRGSVNGRGTRVASFLKYLIYFTKVGPLVKPSFAQTQVKSQALLGFLRHSDKFLV